MSVPWSDTGRHGIQGESRTRTAPKLRAIVALVGFVQATHAKQLADTAKHLADTRTREAVALKLTSQGQAILAGVQAGGDVPAIQQILAAPVIAPSTDISALLTAVVERQTTVKIIPACQPKLVAVSPDGQRIVTTPRLGGVGFWAGFRRCAR
jgi:hypothetical protein